MRTDDGGGTATATSVRLARPEDVPAILAIANWAALHTPANFAVEPEPLDMWRTSYESTFERYPWLVADGRQGGGGVIGFAKAGPWKGRCAYAYSAEVTVYVHPDHHGRGVGRALYSVLFPTLEAQGYRTILAGITLPNPASVRLHESFGMHRVAMLEAVGWKFERWHDVGYWERRFGGDGPPRAVLPVRSVLAGR
jgi:phosphinothricin acetyltransferase